MTRNPQALASDRRACDVGRMTVSAGFVALRIAVAATLGLPMVAKADEARCARPELGWETWRDNVVAANAGIRSFELEGEARREVLRAYSCEKPGGDCPPDHVMVFHCSGNARVLIAFVRNGCVTMAEDVSIDAFTGFIEGGKPC